MNIDQLNQIYETESPRFIAEWKEYLEFPSISTDPAHLPDCRACAAWLVRHLSGMGLKSELIETGTKPVVFAHWAGNSARRKVVFYGHYDVQPVDPLEAWQSKPFSPEIRADRLYARGAQDNKGQSFAVLKAIEILVKAKTLDCPLTIVLEGEEEDGSKAFANAIPSLIDRLKSNVLMVCDTAALRAGVPGITMGLRGIVHFTAKLRGPGKDLHSGVHGGVCQNPAMEMARLLSQLHQSDGSIAVPGFYDGVALPTVEEKRLVNSFPLTEKDYVAMVGVEPLGGEKAFSIWERRGLRPTVELNGVTSGYTGIGHKTVLPAEAMAKISARIVAGQDPKRCLDLLTQFLIQKTPPGLKLEISDATVGGPALRLATESDLVKEAQAVLKEISGYDPTLIWEGASIPVVAELAKASGAEPLLVGFGLEEDNMHAPNESFALGQFKQAFMYAGRMLQKF